MDASFTGSTSYSIEEVNSFEQESISASVYDLPNGERSWIPFVSPEFKPYVGAKFRTLDEVVVMYEEYAQMAGFCTRLGTTKKREGIIKTRYILCSKANKPKDQEEGCVDISSASSSRSVNFKVTDCKALIKVRLIKGSSDYEIYGFEEVHNHGPLSSNHLTKKRRKLDFATKEFISGCRLVCVGPTKAFKLHVALKGGHHNLKGTLTDYNNFGRDIREAIADGDAQMVVDKFNERSKNVHNFTFKYQVVGTELKSLFWADNVSKINYKAFGDVLAFDATYHTNMYDMIFVPFTGVDHHKKCTVFGAGLLSNETVESYTWLLQMFLDTHVKQPTFVLTDQDPSMKQAVRSVLDKSIHRLCIWHIVTKLPLKIDGNLLNNSNLRRSIHKLVWNVYIDPETFERRWNRLMNEYGLQDHEWLSEMYAIRDQWVPGYFRNVPMCCLMKTTSRCESANHLFKTNSSSHNTLVQFMLCFETTMDGQRNEQGELQDKTETTSPKFKTPFPIERHANEVYTRAVFLEVQKEMYKAMCLCYIVSREESSNIHSYVVAHQNHLKHIVNEYKVTLDTSDFTVTCECLGFTRIGYLCRHAFCIYRHHEVDKIPMKYINKRWLRDALPIGVYSMENRYNAYKTQSSIIRHRIFDNIQMCTDRLRCNIDNLEELDQQIQAIKDKIFEEFPLEPTHNKGVVIEELLSHKIPTEVLIRAPKGIRNKGSRKKKRPIGPGEKAKKKIKNKKRKKRKKSRRKCNFCEKLVRLHDKRNCPLKLGIPDIETGETSTDEDSDDDDTYDEETDDETNGKESNEDI